MSTLLQKQKLGKFIIMYDGGSEGTQTMDISHEDYYNNLEFHLFIIYQKCLDCNLESHFEKV